MTALLDLLFKGGPLVWLLLCCFALALAIFAERLAYYHRASMNVGEFLAGLASLIRRKNHAEALQECVATRVPAGVTSGDLQRVLVHEFPNVSAIDLTLVLENVRGILGKISRVISLLAGFTVLAGLPILIGTLLNGRDQRLRESILLRTLGASAKQVRTILFIEYATLGTLSALAGLLLAIAANTALAVFAFKVAPWPDPVLIVAAFAATTGLAILGGLALSRGVSRHPPLEILRSV